MMLQITSKHPHDWLRHQFSLKAGENLVDESAIPAEAKARIAELEKHGAIIITHVDGAPAEVKAEAEADSFEEPLDESELPEHVGSTAAEHMQAAQNRRAKANRR